MHHKKPSTFTVSCTTGKILDLIPKKPEESKHLLASTAQPVLLENGYCVVPYVVCGNDEPQWRMGVMDLQYQTCIPDFKCDFSNKKDDAKFNSENTNRDQLTTMKMVALPNQNHFVILDVRDNTLGTFHNFTFNRANQRKFEDMNSYTIVEPTIVAHDQSIIGFLGIQDRNNDSSHYLKQFNCFSAEAPKQLSKRMNDAMMPHSIQPMVNNIVATAHDQAIILWRQGLQMVYYPLANTTEETEGHKSIAVLPCGMKMVLHTPQANRNVFSLLEFRPSNREMTNGSLILRKKYTLENGAELQQLYWCTDDVLMAHVVENANAESQEKVHRLKAIQLIVDDNKKFIKHETTLHTFSFAPYRLEFCGNRMVAYGEKGEYEHCIVFDNDLKDQLRVAIASGGLPLMPYGLYDLIAYHAYPGMFPAMRSVENNMGKGNAMAPKMTPKATPKMGH